ncbi:hypothetical protein H2201_009126 [Coniosporium apollinis]|uniref:Uncharacterized protein n=1 Tax=Coniosporium apollinis TaxID=61459 RepID=A0ABQ9NL09_9PEZI|nr:hypothetical protein H2201_009126 [Coniosporium apollinis]
MANAQAPGAGASPGEGGSSSAPVSKNTLRTMEEIRAAHEGPYFSLDCYRIRWPVFGELSDILVLDDPADASSTARPFKTAEGWHPVAAAPVSHPPFSSTKISIFNLENHEEYEKECCHCWDEMDENDDEANDDMLANCPDHYHAPKPILVTSPEGGAVTVRDVVITVNPYFNAHKEKIVEVTSIGVPDNLPPGGVKYGAGGEIVEYEVSLSLEPKEMPPNAKFYAPVSLFGSMDLFCALGPEHEEREWKKRADSARSLKKRGYRDP